MKKFFMIAASVCLAMGVAGCEKGPGNGPEGNGTETGMGLSIVLPNGSGSTRQELGGITGTTGESSVQSLDLFVFDSSRNAPSDDALGWQRWSATTDPTFAAGFAKSTNTYTLQNAFPTIAGSVRIWVGLNLPDDFGGAGKYATEADMLRAFRTVAALTNNGTLNAANGMAMFSNAKPADLAVQPSDTPVGDLAASNKVSLNIYRTVARVLATLPTGYTAGTADWKIVWNTVDGVTPTMTYSPTHWRVFQHATSTYVAPNYDIVSYNNATPPAARPRTYIQDNAAIISTYAMDGQVSTSLTLVENPSTDAARVALTGSKYVGENAAGGATGQSTLAFISTKVLASNSVAWDSTNKVIKWGATQIGEGTGAGNTDIYYIRYQDKHYVANKANYDGIIAGLAEVFRYQLHDAAGTMNPGRTDGWVDILKSDFPAAIGLQSFVYKDSYVHFPHFIDRQGDQNVLRNQFVHINVSGMNTNKKDVFLGYPGQDPAKKYQLGSDVAPNTDGNTGVPIDMYNADNNPYLVNPLDPLDPEQTAMQVVVEVKPWHYKTEDAVLE